MRDSALCDVILAAFPMRPFPAGEALVVDTYDDEGTGVLFARHDWYELHAAGLINTSLVFLSPAAFAYYLPALLLAALEYPESNLAENLRQYLIPPKGDRKRPSFAAWWDKLDVRQRNVITIFQEISK